MKIEVRSRKIRKRIAGSLLDEEGRSDNLMDDEAVKDGIHQL